MQAIPLNCAVGAGSRLLEQLRSATSLTHSGLRLVGATFAEARQMQLEARRRFHFLDD